MTMAMAAITAVAIKLRRVDGEINCRDPCVRFRAVLAGVPGELAPAPGFRRLGMLNIWFSTGPPSTYDEKAREVLAFLKRVDWRRAYCGARQLEHPSICTGKSLSSSPAKHSPFWCIAAPHRTHVER